MTPAERLSTDPAVAERERAAVPAVIDVSALPEVVFGRRALTWWATAGFMLCEGTTLAIVATSYLYLRINAAEWPPRPASSPELLIPTLNVTLLLLKMVPAHFASAAAKRFDLGGVRRWLLVTSTIALVTVVLRWFELGALNVRWDTNAYGSALWAIYVAHSLLLLTDALELMTMTAIFFTDRVEPKHFPDVEDGTVYEYFLSVAWAGLYVLVILGPRWL